MARTHPAVRDKSDLSQARPARHVRRLATAGLLVSLVLGVGVPRAHTAEPPAWLEHVISHDTSAGSGFVLRVTVAADDGFIQRHGATWQRDAASTVMGAADRLAEIDIALQVRHIERWTSRPVPLPDLISVVVDQVGVPDDSVLIALSTLDPRVEPNFDGWAAASVPAVVVRVDEPSNSTLDSLIAHELGHMLGLDDHGADGCHDHGCLMEGLGYRDGDHWCLHHMAAVALMLSLVP